MHNTSKKIIAIFLLRAIPFFGLILYNTFAKSGYFFIFTIISHIFLIYGLISISYLSILSIINDIMAGFPIGTSSLFIVISSYLHKKYNNGIAKNIIMINYKYYFFINTIYHFLIFFSMKICHYNFYFSDILIEWISSMIVYVIISLILVNTMPRYNFIKTDTGKKYLQL